MSVIKILCMCAMRVYRWVFREEVGEMVEVSTSVTSGQGFWDSDPGQLRTLKLPRN